MTEQERLAALLSQEGCSHYREGSRAARSFADRLLAAGVRLSPDDGLRAALENAVTLYRDANPNTRQVPDGLNAILNAAIALVDSWLPTADDVRGILAPRAALAAPAPPPTLDAALLRQAVREAGYDSGWLGRSDAERIVREYARLSGNQQAAEDREVPEQDWGWER